MNDECDDYEYGPKLGKSFFDSKCAIKNLTDFIDTVDVNYEDLALDKNSHRIDGIHTFSVVITDVEEGYILTFDRFGDLRENVYSLFSLTDYSRQIVQDFLMNVFVIKSVEYSESKIKGVSRGNIRTVKMGPNALYQMLAITLTVDKGVVAEYDVNWARAKIIKGPVMPKMPKGTASEIPESTPTIRGKTHTTDGTEYF